MMPMSNILLIESSPRSASISSLLAAQYVEGLKKQDPAAIVVRHNTTNAKLPYVNEAIMTAFFGMATTLTEEQKQAVALSDRLIDEFLAADVIVLGVPMWNLGIPASLKAWVDLISRSGRTFQYTAGGGIESLVPAGKKVVVFVARGGAYPAGTPYEAYDHVDPYLRTIFVFFGITDVTIIHADNQNRSGEAPAAGLAAAKEELAALLA
jgi:FMN-dependent NADH-azoreductase